MIAVDADPVVVFGSVLRALREKAGLSQRELAARVFCSPSLVSAVELGTKPAKLDLVERIDGELNAGGMLVKVWPITTAGNYPSWFAYVAELEKEACKVHEWELRTIPGLLQTPDYARVLMRAVRPRDNDEKSKLTLPLAWNAKRFSLGTIRRWRGSFWTSRFCIGRLAVTM